MLFKALSDSYFTGFLRGDLYGSLLAAFFLAAGVYFGTRTRLFGWFGPAIRKRLATVLARKQTPGEPDIGPVEHLSRRELEVLSLIAEGYSNEEIADRLYIALSTVKTHLINIYAKLNVRRRTQAIARAREIGLLDSP